MADRPNRAKLRLRPNPEGLWNEEKGPDPRLSRSEIVEAALELLEKDGFEAFSMRGLATALNIKSPSLYWHFRSKDELFDLVVDAVLGECRLPAADEADWAERLTSVAREIRRVLLAHPAATRLLTGRVPLGPNWLRLAEYVIGTLRRAYGELGLDASEDGFARMQRYIENKPQHSAGVHSYKKAAAETSVIAAERAAYARYQQYFGVPNEHGG